MDPTRIRDFVVEKPLGAGGMATVYLAKREGTGERVALKLMHAHLASNESFVKRFLREIAASAELKHENIVRVLECGQDAGTYFIASEFVDSGTLESLVAKHGRLPAAVAAEVARQLFVGLEVAHERGIVHRDIKPANLLLSASGLVKIADFGIAKVEAATQLTQTGGVLGTPAYMSPEQALGKPFDLRTDLFSAGVVFYELLTGNNPFVADSPAATMVRIARSEAPMVQEVCPATPPELADLAESLLEKDPSRRPVTAAQPAKVLEAWLTSMGLKGRAALAAYLRDPPGTARRANDHMAGRCVEAARALLATGPTGFTRAVLELHRALQASPEHAAAKALMQEVQAQAAISFGPGKSPKIHELEAMLETAANPVGLLTQLSSLYRLEGNVFKAVMCLRRAVRLRPNDGYLAGQLSTLTGARPAPAPTVAFTPIPLTQPASGGLSPPGPAVDDASRFAPPAPADDGELHTGQTGMVRPRAPTSVIPPLATPLVDPIPLPPPSPLAPVKQLWDAGGKYLVIGLLVVGGLWWGVRRAGRGIDYLTAEDAKAHAMVFKAADRRARDMLAPMMRDQQASWSRRYGDPLDEEFQTAFHLARGGNPQQAAEAFGTIAAKAGDRPIGAAAQLGRANALYDAGSFDGAVAELDAFLARNGDGPDAPDARALRVEALQRAGRQSDCVDAATALLDAGGASPASVRIRVARARCALQAGQREMARSDARFLMANVASTDPAYVSATEILAAVEPAP